MTQNRFLDINQDGLQLQDLENIVVKWQMKFNVDECEVVHYDTGTVLVFQ